MDPRAKRGCRTCRSRTKQRAEAYAKSLGISVDRLQRLGGEQRLRALDPAARAILTGPYAYGNSQALCHGGLKARGMRSRVPGVQRFLIPPRVDMRMPVEMLASDGSAGVEGWE